MKTTDFKLWDVFKNTDGVLGVVYLITKERVYVVSDKGSLYQLKRHDYPVSYKVIKNFDPHKVFKAFFINNLCGYSGKIEIANIVNRYNVDKAKEQTITDRRLYLLI